MLGDVRVFPLGSCCGRSFFTWEGWARHLGQHRRLVLPVDVGRGQNPYTGGVQWSGCS
jgi:hypothetical protein